MREIDNGVVVSLDSGHQPKFNYGLDANKQANPTFGDTYYATDTHITYACYVNGSWSIGVSGATAGGTGTILANENSVTVPHGLISVPNWALAAPINDVAKGAILGAVVSGVNIIVSYPVGVTQPADGTFAFIVGL